jgi:hypothetical protein
MLLSSILHILYYIKCVTYLNYNYIETPFGWCYSEQPPERYQELNKLGLEIIDSHDKNIVMILIIFVIYMHVMVCGIGYLPLKFKIFGIFAFSTLMFWLLLGCVNDIGLLAIKNYVANTDL